MQGPTSSSPCQRMTGWAEQQHSFRCSEFVDVDTSSEREILVAASSNWYYINSYKLNSISALYLIAGDCSPRTFTPPSTEHQLNISRTPPHFSHTLSKAQLRHVSTMRTVLASLLFAPLAFAVPDTLAAFEPALQQLERLSASNNDTTPIDSIAELLKRQGNSCANNYYACNNLNAPGLCCPRTAICSADRNNVVACCPQGAACTGTLSASVTDAVTASTTVPFAIASTTSGPFVQATTANAGSPGSTVNNAFYPFPYIATTYTNAAACSSAYTRCQSDAASCTNALMGGAQGVTISAPNGGATITAVPSLGQASASSICSSLSQEACYGLQVAACQAFDGSGNAAPTRGCGGLAVGMGVALGVAGQLL